MKMHYVIAGNLYFAHVLPIDELDGLSYKCDLYNNELRVTSGGSQTRIVITGKNALFCTYSVSVIPLSHYSKNVLGMCYKQKMSKFMVK